MADYSVRSSVVEDIHFGGIRTVFIQRNGEDYFTVGKVYGIRETGCETDEQIDRAAERIAYLLNLYGM